MYGVEQEVVAKRLGNKGDSTRPQGLRPRLCVIVRRYKNDGKPLFAARELALQFEAADSGQPQV